MKQFFNKAKLEMKFRRAGPGHSLSEEKPPPQAATGSAPGRLLAFNSCVAHRCLVFFLLVTFPLLFNFHPLSLPSCTQLPAILPAVLLSLLVVPPSHDWRAREQPKPTARAAPVLLLLVRGKDMVVEVLMHALSLSMPRVKYAYMYFQ